MSEPKRTLGTDRLYESPTSILRLVSWLLYLAALDTNANIPPVPFFF